MPDDATATGISEVGTVFVPVSDQDRSLEFFVGQLGFEKRAEFAYGEQHRWIEVAPPGAANALALVPPSEGASAGGDVARCAFAAAWRRRIAQAASAANTTTPPASQYAAAIPSTAASLAASVTWWSSADGTR